jgi:predicted lactoylglutathione lyase
LKRINFVTLGVQDLIKSKRFFFDLFGWMPQDQESNDIVFFDMGGWMLALYPWKLLAEDITILPEGNGFRGFALAHNVPTKEDVGKMLELAERCGAKIIKPAQDVFWGGHSGYFQDLDGYYWEIAWNPFYPLLPDGTLAQKIKQ